MNLLLSCVIFLILSSGMIVVPLEIIMWGQNAGRDMFATVAVAIIGVGIYTGIIQYIMQWLKENYGMQDVIR